MKLRPALEEARRASRQIADRSHTEADIATRAELSRAKHTLAVVTEMIYGQGNIGELPAKLKDMEAKINDLLKYIDKAMANVREVCCSVKLNKQSKILLDLSYFCNGKSTFQGFELNARQNASLSRTMSKCADLRSSQLDARNVTQTASDLLKQSSHVLAGASSYFQNLDDGLERLARHGQKLEGAEMGLSAVVEDYRARFVMPCRANAEKLVATADQLHTMFENMVGVSADEALQAANVYKSMMVAIDDAREASFKAMDAALLAFQVRIINHVSIYTSLK